jgi:hypothetical protein
VHAVLIDPYPYRDAMRMVHLHLYDKDPVPYDLALDGPQFVQFAKSPVLDGAVAEDVYTMALTGAELPEQLQVGRMSPDAFDYFGVPVRPEPNIDTGREFTRHGIGEPRSRSNASRPAAFRLLRSRFPRGSDKRGFEIMWYWKHALA